MTNDQVVAARRVILSFPLLKVSIAKASDVETITPYEIATPSNTGATVSVTGRTPASQLSAELLESCKALANE